MRATRATQETLDAKAPLPPKDLRMTKTLYVEFRGNGFWAFDVSAAVFLKHLIDVANEHLCSNDDQWLCDAIRHWQITVAAAELAWFADNTWTPEQVATVIQLSKLAIRTILEKGDIPAATVTAWRILESHSIFCRGFDPIPALAVVGLGDAFVDLLQGSLATPPTGHQWFFTLDSPARQVIRIER